MDAAAGRAAPHLLEPLKSASYSSPSPRVKRTHAANQMKSVQRANGSLAQSGARPLCGLRLLDSGKSSLYPSVLCRVKRTHIANQMKRVQRVEDSLAQSGARPQCGFHISPQRTPRGKRRNRLARPADQPPRAQTLLPALKPAKRNIAPARNSRSYKARQRIAATARCSAQGHILRFPIPARGHRLLRTSRPKHTPPRRIHASAQISAGRHFQ